ncbi:MAG TPA: ABC transporter ATP-binding protein [Candidatus Angelobacter sp.]|nr:ABC transporter ATP-binding protein [Candidatus Angelobacter sp.]
MREFLPLLRYFRRQPRYLALIALFTLATSLLASLQPWPMALLADNVLKSGPVPAVLQRVLNWFSLAPTTIVLLCVVVFGTLLLFALNSFMDAALTWCWTVAGRRMVYDVAEDVFARLQSRSILFHKRNPVGDSMSRVTVDSWCVYQMAESLVFSPAHALLATVIMIFLMAQLDMELTILALVIAPFMVGSSFLLGKPLRAAARLKREIESRVHAHIQQTLTGIPVVQAFAQEERESLRFQKFADAAIRSQQRSALLGSINSLSSGLITTLGSGLILLVGARHALGPQHLGVGSILIFLVYLNSLQAQMKVFAGIYTSSHNLSANARRVAEILETPSEIEDKPDAAALPPARGQIQFENVSAGYEAGNPVLKNISFIVPAGQTIAIVGATGVGKTTLVSLIPRFADPWRGRVLIDGRDIRNVRLKSLRDQVGIVLQEAFLFPVTIAENIAYGKPDASRKEIEAAAKAANAHEFISALPQGYDTLIGERGATLSGGERQRLSIARALLRNPPILILDEPTSALDAETERSIIDALQRLTVNRTTFVIAHRLSTVRRANRLLVLKDGQIVESGTHEELIARNGYYARLNHPQIENATARQATTS